MRKNYFASFIAGLFLFMAAAPVGAAVSISENYRTVTGNKKTVGFTITMDSSYATGGESLTAANLGFQHIYAVITEPTAGYKFDYDYTNAKLKAYGITAKAFTITDSDTPSTPGGRLYVSIIDGALGRFVSPNAGGSADSYFALNSSMGMVGVGYFTDTSDQTWLRRVWFDDTATAGSRLLVSNLTLSDLWVPTSAGDLIKLTHTTSVHSYASVYFDDDAAGTTARLFVSTSQSASTTENTSSSVGMRFGEVASTTDLSSVTVRITVIGY